MELTVTLDHGPLNAEFTGEDREKVEENLVGFIEFLEGNDELFNGHRDSVPATNDTEDPGLDEQYWKERADDQGDQTTSESDSTESPLSDIAHKVGASVTELEGLIYFSVDDEELPMLLFDDPERVGGSVVERQRNSALVLLLIWEECYGKKKMKTSQFKDVLEMMDLSTSNVYRAWEKSYFKQAGNGPSATVRLRGPGKREARSVLKDMLEYAPD